MLLLNNNINMKKEIKKLFIQIKNFLNKLLHKIFKSCGPTHEKLCGPPLQSK